MVDITPKKIEANFYETPLPDVVQGMSIDATPQPNNPATPSSGSNIVPSANGSVLAGGAFQSPNYSVGVAGWKIDANGDVEFGSGKFRGNITGASGTFSGTITATTGSIGGWSISSTAIYYDGATDAVSAGMAPADYPFYAGAKYANRATAPLRITPAGALFASSVEVTGKITAGVGSSIASDYLSGIIAQANLNVSNRGWVQTSVFSLNATTPATQVDWAAGTFTSADGTAYSILAGNTGVMAAKTYIYLDTAVSIIAYQITTTAATAVGVGKVLIAIAQNGTGEATFFVFNGQGGLNINAADIVAGSITATELADLAVSNAKLAASAVTTAKIAADAVTAAEIAVGAVGSTELAAGAVIAGKITAGTIVAADIATGTITGAKIAATTITAANIAALTITAAEIAASTITGAKIAATTITAANITALTITAAEIAASTITGAKIAATTIAAGNIVAGTITGNEIAASTITAGKLSVTQLSAIAADLGAITAGTVTLPTTGWIKGGQTDYNTGAGFFLGYSGGAYKFSVGNTNNYLNYNGTNLKLYSNLADGITLDYGSNILLKEGGSIKFTSVTAPTACTATLVETGTGNVDNGTHDYKVTYVNAAGETEAGTISNVVTVDATHKQVSLSAIPISTSISVIARKIYRTKAGGMLSYFLVTTINDNTTTTYIDNIADASLTGENVNFKENDTFGKIFIDGIEGLSLGIHNTFVGQYSGTSNIVSGDNSTLGAYSLYSNTTGNDNTAIGYASLYSNTTGYDNVALGYKALYSNTTGYFNTAIGRTSLDSNTTGFNNTAIGLSAGGSITTGSKNTFVGYGTGNNASQKVDATNSMALGYNAYTTADNQVVIGDTGITETLLRGNVKIAGTAARATTAGTNALHIFDGTAPAGTLANGCSIYSTAGELYTMDAAGNATLQTPHDKKTNEWIFESVNTVTGKRVRIDMEKMMRKLNDKFGWDFIHDILE